MTRLYLFTVFHANFDFSSIPPRHYSSIIDRCFWPVLECLERYPELRLGVELPADSLAKAQEEDPLFVSALCRLEAAGRLEIVGSGLVQAILPLLPEEANRRILFLGQKRYRELLGASPVTAFVNEQVLSSGLLDLYRQSGFNALVVDWENSNAACGLSPTLAHHPLQLTNGQGTGLTVLWNSTVAFQKFQRYLHGEIEIDAYLEFVTSQWSETEDRVFCLYGGDWEIIDYRPGDVDFGYRGEANAGREMKRLVALIEALSKDRRLAWVLPQEAKKIGARAAAASLTSAANPLPTKKQPRYNATRWAVCGRSSPTANAECFLLYRYLRLLEAMKKAGRGRSALVEESVEQLWEELCRLWGSDFRTHTTTEKWLDFARRVGAALQAGKRAVEGACGELAQRCDIALFNPLDEDWLGHPFECLIHFAPGVIHGEPLLVLDGAAVELQLEEPKFYRDGSLKEAVLVFCPKVPACGSVRGSFVDSAAPLKIAPSQAEETIRSASVHLSLNRKRGGTIRSLAFPRISQDRLAGTIEHGSFARIELTPDWYSGGVVIVDRDGSKVTDLGPASFHPVSVASRTPIRSALRCRVETEFGPIWKTYYVYEREPRVDLRYHFRFKDLKPRSFRLGILTVDPLSFEKESLRYATVNGQRTVESFPLRGSRVEHDQPVSFSVSARGCVGATEGWIDVGDERRGIALIRDLAELYTVPLVHYEEVDDLFLLRVYLSAGESDDTSAVLWRGHVEVGVRYYGRGADLEGVRAEASRCNLGLHAVWGSRKRVRGWER